VPLVVVVVLDRALRTDAGVVDEQVQPAEFLGGGSDRLSNGAVISDVGLDEDHALPEVAGRAVQDRHRCTLGGQ